MNNLEIFLFSNWIKFNLMLAHRKNRCFYFCGGTTGVKYEFTKVKIEELLEAGVHFGHNVRRWNPKMEQYIFGVRNNIHIFDLRITFL